MEVTGLPLPEGTTCPFCGKTDVRGLVYYPPKSPEGKHTLNVQHLDRRECDGPAPDELPPFTPRRGEG